MYIYKITCKVNNKIYIGQTKNSIKSRFENHIKNALNNNLNTHLARAIRKYGKENFIVEQIDSANTSYELTEKEYFWIDKLQSTDPEIGFNETLNKNRCGGNTYKNKTQLEMLEIKQKISKSNSGKNNGMAKGVKAKNIETNLEYHFGSTAECARFFNTYLTDFIRKRCNADNSLYKDKWLFAWEDDAFKSEYHIFDPSTRKGTKIQVED